MLRVVDLFCGIGTAEQALKELGIEFETIAVAEIDKYALQSYEAMHGKPNNLGDISKIPELPDCDLLMYSAPCTDISNAGKQAGIAEGSGTRSSLIWEVKRLLFKAQELGQLPKYLVMENVKALVGKNFKPYFDAWLEILNGLGYTSYWQVLNTRWYNIPQNRERVFCVSIRGATRLDDSQVKIAQCAVFSQSRQELCSQSGEHEPYRFPEKRELRLRLKDMLDTEVDEKFYLSERALKSLGHSTFNIERGRLQDLNGVHRTCCARDHKSPTVVPECIRAGDLAGGKWDKMHEMSKRVFDPCGVSPSVLCAQGGNTEIKIVDDTYNGREPRVYSEVAPSIRSEQHNFKVVAGQFQPVNRDYKEDGEPRTEQFECRKDEVSNAVLIGDKKNCVKIVAMRGRENGEGGYTQQLEPNEEGLTNTLTSVAKDNLVLESPQVLRTQRTEYGKESRKAYEAHEIPGDRKAMREQVPRTDGVSNTLTTVQKDNLLVEPTEQGGTFVGRAYNNFIDKKGYVPELFNAYNRAEIMGEAPTLTTQCGSPTASGSILKAETDEVSKCVRVGGHGLHERHTWDVIAVKEATKKGYAEAEPGDYVNTQFPGSETKRGRVGKGVTNALLCNDSNAVVTDAVRIRKLTPFECMRLQGWRDCEIAKIRAAGVSNTQIYRQAGNGISTTVLMAIFGELFGAEYKCLLDNWRY